MIYYLFTILDNIHATLILLLLILGGLSLVCLIANLNDEDDELKQKGKTFYKWWFAVLILTTFLPTQRQMAFVIAAPHIIENENIQDAGSNLTEIIKEGTSYLKEVLHEKRTQTISNRN